MSKKKLTHEVMAQIQEDREVNGMTITEIAAKYSFSKGTAYAAIRDMDSSNVMRAAPSRPVVSKVERHHSRPPLSKTNLGEASRQIIAARLMFAGLHVFRPLTEDTPVDILVLRRDGTPIKCQCKCFFVEDSGRHVMSLVSIRKWGPSSKVVVHRYTREEVDFFLGYLIDNDSVYVIPFDAVSHLKRSVGTWVTREPVGQNKTKTVEMEQFKNAFHLMSS